MATRDPRRFTIVDTGPSVSVPAPADSTTVVVDKTEIAVAVEGSTPTTTVSAGTSTELVTVGGSVGTPGPQGPPGLPGKDGVDGKDGRDGKDGINGTGAVNSVNGLAGDIELTVNEIPGASPIDSPAFTGIPTAPTPPLSSKDITIATTAFVYEAINSRAYIDLSDGYDIYIEPEDYLFRILTITGRLVRNTEIILPTMAKDFEVENRTTGQFSVTLKNEAGSRKIIGQNTQHHLYTNGTQIAESTTEFNNITVSDSYANTPPLSDSSTRIATTEFIKKQGYITADQVPVKSVFGRTGDIQLTEQDIDQFVQMVQLDGGTF
jgi:hypothetical protein